MRINLVMPDELVSQIDVLSKSLNISRSAYICMACSQKIQENSVISALPDMVKFLKKMDEEKAE